MRIILSPAKKMKIDTDSLDYLSLPQFLPETQMLLTALRTLDYAASKALWCCNDKLAAFHFAQLSRIELTQGLTPAILSYEGLQYQYMAPSILETQQLSYLQEHLRILSGFYGLLRPFDGVTPYRLELQARLSVNGCKDLYHFWGDKLAQQLCAETDCILNLASKEYSRAITPHLPASMRLVTCTFGEWVQGRVLEKGTRCKMARGEMVRFLAERAITQPQELCAFDRLGYTHAAALSTAHNLVFLAPAAV